MGPDAFVPQRQETNQRCMGSFKRTTGMSSNRIKEKKDSLMATFRGHLRKKKASIRSGAGVNDIYKPIWFAYEYMESFLSPVYECQSTINTQDTVSTYNR